MKRLVVVSDLHCGHIAGLTHPDYQMTAANGPKQRQWAEMQSKLWTWYTDKIKTLGKIDVLVCNGDAIEGKADRTGGTELITADRRRQVEMARKALDIMRAEKICIVYGTPYHVGREEDWEAILADSMGASCKSHLFLDVEGTVFDIKHRVSSSIIPYGRLTAPLREKVWNVLWAERGEQPRAEVIIRSHVHYYGYAGDARGLVITTPALQGPGSKYGARMCAGTIDFGFLVFECDQKSYIWRPELCDMRGVAERAIRA
jgi:hypothetical protein